MRVVPLVVPLTRSDPQGDGAFLAARSGRAHYGRDYQATPGELIYLARPATYVKTGIAYSGAPEFKYIELYDGEYRLRYFYSLLFDDNVEPGDRLPAGQPFAMAQDIAAFYNGGMENHCHVEVYREGVHVVPGCEVIRRDRWGSTWTYYDPDDYFNGRLP